MAEQAPHFKNAFGHVAGGSRQRPDWIAANADGWMIDPRPALQQAYVINDYRARIKLPANRTSPSRSRSTWTSQPPRTLGRGQFAPPHPDAHDPRKNARLVQTIEAVIAEISR